MALTGLSFSLLGIACTKIEAQQTKPHQPEANNGTDYLIPLPNPQNEKEFRIGVMGPAVFSHETSQVAVNKASNNRANKFANFELREAIAVTTVLKELMTPVPTMDPAFTAILAKLKSEPEGNTFDKDYISAQVSNHEYLRDLAESYLKNSEGKTSPAELQARHLATIALSTFKEHVVHTKDILAILV